MKLFDSKSSALKSEMCFSSSSKLHTASFKVTLKLQAMHLPQNNTPLFFSFLLLLLSSLRSSANVGTAAHYGPPYLPTACFGSDPSPFPPNGLFAAAGGGVWDDGASCGREYLVRCLSSATPGACADGGPTIQVTVVDWAGGLTNSRPSVPGTTLVLSQTAFGMIAELSADEINIEFTAV